MASRKRMPMDSMAEEMAPTERKLPPWLQKAKPAAKPAKKAVKKPVKKPARKPSKPAY